MKTRGIIIIAGIFAIIIAVIFLPNNSIVVRPGIEDNPQILTNTSLDVSSSRADEPIVTESIVISSVQEEIPFYIDENGTKHYTIVSVDRPDIHGDQSP